MISLSTLITPKADNFKETIHTKFLLSSTYPKNTYKRRKIIVYEGYTST